MAGKRIPLRTCIGCGETRDKRALIRIVKGQDGGLWIDESQRANGRGAYLCGDPACLQKARKRKAFQRAFPGGVSAGEYERLARQLEVCLQGKGEDG